MRFISNTYIKLKRNIQFQIVAETLLHVRTYSVQNIKLPGNVLKETRGAFGYLLTRGREGCMTKVSVS